MPARNEKTSLYILPDPDSLNVTELRNQTFPTKVHSLLLSEVYYLDPNLEPKDISNNSFGIFTLRNISLELIRFVPELSDNSGKITKSIEDFRYQKSLKHD